MRIKCNIERLAIPELNLKLVKDDCVIIDDNVARNSAQLNNAIRLKQVLVLRFKEYEKVVRLEASNEKRNLDDLKIELQQQKEELTKLFDDKLSKIEKLLSEINSKSTVSTVYVKETTHKSQEKNQNEVQEEFQDESIKIPIITKILDKEVETNISDKNISKIKSKSKTKTNVDLLKKMKM